jgi:hypothetical protein
MKYYQVGLDVEVTGVSNGLYQIDIHKNLLKKNNVYEDFLNFFDTKNITFWERQDEIKNFNIPTIRAKLLKKATLTDIMGYTQSIPFLYNAFSEKYINIIKTFIIGNHTTFEVEIENVPEKYFLLFIETITSDEINYDRSSVITGYKATNNVKYYSINNRQEFKEFLHKNPLGRFEKISISKEYFGKDIICIQSAVKPFYSEKLIDFLLDCGITGLEVNYKNSIQLEFA